MVTTKKPKLTQPQLHVLRRLSEGWEATEGGTLSDGPWMQKDGIGRGGESERIRAGTLSKLYRLGLIRSGGYVPGFPTPYRVTDAGRALVAQPTTTTAES